MMKLFMLLLGCKPPGRKTEQHDVFFGISNTVKELIPRIIESWDNAGKIHVDAWREVNFVDGYEIEIIPKELREGDMVKKINKLFFINLGGYKQNEFEEFHYKMLVIGENKMVAIQQAKSTAFYKHTRFEGAPAHIDDKYGVDVDEIYEIEDIISVTEKKKYTLQISPAVNGANDQLHLGYFPLDKL